MSEIVYREPDLTKYNNPEAKEKRREVMEKVKAFCKRSPIVSRQTLERRFDI